MTRNQPSSLTRSILRFVESGNEALAGDLAEEWRAGRSRRWLWSQLARAVVATALQNRASAATARRAMAIGSGPADDRFRLIDPATMNLRGMRVAGVGGGGLLGVVMLITIVMPQAWFVVVAGMAGGALIALTTIVRRHDRGLAGPDDAAPLTLFGSGHEDAGVEIEPAARHPRATRFAPV